MEYTDLEQLNDKSRLLELARNIWKKHQSGPNGSGFSMYYRSFQMTQGFLREIWDRIVRDVRLDNDYWSIQAGIHDAQELQEDYKLSTEEAKTLDEYEQHKCRLNLDVEDWFLHAHILMEKYTKLFKIIISLTQPENNHIDKIPNRSFHEHTKLFLNANNGITSKKYSELVKLSVEWYFPDIKDVRDDLITHEQIGRFWGSSITPKRFSISRFIRADGMVSKLNELAEKYQKTYAILEKERNIFNLMSFFEANIARVEAKDAQLIKNIRKNYGRDFPNIPKLYFKMNNFFSSVNDYFLQELVE